MSKLTERQRLALTIGVSVLLTGALVFLVFQDRNEIEQVETEIKGLEQRIQAADVEIRKIRPRENKVLVFRAVENEELRILPTEQKIADFHRNLSTFLEAAGLRFRELPESKPEASELAKGISVTRNRLVGRGDAAAILKFMNMIENDPRLVAIKQFAIQAGSPDDFVGDTPEEVVKVLHDLEIQLETYFYRPDAKNDEVHIPGAERRLQEPEVREAIQAFRPEQPDVYTLRPSLSRRDPLLDPREARPTEDLEGQEEERRRQEEIVLGLEGRWLEIAEMVEKERAFIEIGDIFRADRIGKAIATAVEELLGEVEKVRHMKSVTLADLGERTKAVAQNLERRRAAQPSRKVTITRAVAEGVLNDGQKLFEEAKYDELARLGSGWIGFVRGKDIKPNARPIMPLITRLLERGRIMADWENLTFRVTGTIIDHRNPSRSVAVVNKRPVRPGQTMKESDEVRVERVERGKVYFAFRGEVLAIEVRSGGSS